MGRGYLITSGSKVIAKLSPVETHDRWREAARTELLTRLKGQPASKSTKTRWRRDELYES
jgi:antitoxin (DNA-binding transcriptional repressor) of toxin-antitoxin stability system